MKLKTESEANKDTDVFVGMWRPPYPEVEARYKGCTIGRRPGSRELRDDYLRGDFDEPLYRCVLETPNADSSYPRP